jgi:ubiquinone/menaquinone biosynthesis C-methylase UbiE
MTIPARVRLSAIGLVAAAILSVTVGLPIVAAQSSSSDSHTLIEALDVHAGSIVGEVGAGGGTMTIAMAHEVGDTGRVYTSELGDKNLRTLRSAVDSANLHNVTIVEGDPAKTNFPDACCDALFMQRVYHHFDDPAAMNASLWRSLKPGGRLLVEDFAPNGSEAERPADRDQDGHHGVTADTVKRELEQAGFVTIGTEQEKDRGFRVIVRKPTS